MSIHSGYCLSTYHIICRASYLPFFFFVCFPSPPPPSCMYFSLRQDLFFFSFSPLRKSLSEMQKIKSLRLWYRSNGGWRGEMKKKMSSWIDLIWKDSYSPLSKSWQSPFSVSLCAPTLIMCGSKKDPTVIQIHHHPLPALLSVDTRSLAGLQCLSSPQVKETEREGIQVGRW